MNCNGKPIRSGGLHYFRVHPQQWPHRLQMLRAMGLDTVETYVPWNLHQPTPDAYDFTGFADISGFLRQAAATGLNAIVRPGPYICAEWDNGGLPAWLTDQPGLRLRCADPAYLDAVDRWFDELIPLIAEHQVTRGGNVIMVQVENEYGSYGSDQVYLRHLADGLIARGIDVPLFTSDGPEDHMLTGGLLDGVPATVNFGSDPDAAFATLRRHRPQDPPFCMEFWCGWFDHWGDEHVTRGAGDAAEVLRRMLGTGASVNIYLAHGGTNFGTWAGANRSGPLHDGALLPTVTSYDYDAPIDERGAATEKFWRFREVLAEQVDAPLPQPPPPAPLLPAQRVPLTEQLPLPQALPALTTSRTFAPHPPSFGELGLRHGLALYRATVPGPRRSYPLRLDGLADRAHVFAGGKHLGTLTPEQCTVDLAVPAEGIELELLVESMGRVNYGPRAHEGKGIRAVRHERQFLHQFTGYGISLDSVAALPWPQPSAPSLAPTTVDPAEPAEPAEFGWPVFCRGFLDVAEPADAFLALPGWGKGYLWVNDFCLGRYWAIGPQHTLYLPWPLLRSGRNEIVVLELDRLPAGSPPQLEIRTEPDHRSSSRNSSTS